MTTIKKIIFSAHRCIDTSRAHRSFPVPIRKTLALRSGCSARNTYNVNGVERELVPIYILFVSNVYDSDERQNLRRLNL